MNLRKFFWPALLSVFPVILTVIWFRNGRILGGGDEAFLFGNIQNNAEITNSVWLNYGSGFAVLFWLSRASFLQIINFFNTVLMIPAFSLQVGTFLVLMVTGILSMYYLMRYYLNSYKYKEYVAFLSAFFYLFNPYSMSQVWGRGQYAQFFSFAWLPLAILIFTFGIRSRKYFFSFLFVLLSVLFSTSYGFLTFSVVQWSVLSILVIYELIAKGKNNNKDIFPIKFFLLSISLWTLVHAWWLLPLILSGPSILSVHINNPGENIGSLLAVSQSYSFPTMIRLLQSFYFFSEHAYSPYYQIIRFQMISWIPVIGLVLGILAVLKSKVFSQGKLFFIIFIVGLIVSLGANPPLGSAFVYIFERIPILQMFRNPYEKYGLVYVIGYSPLFAIGVVSTLEFLFKKTHLSKIYALIIGLLLIIILNIYLWPMWTGRIFIGPDKNIGVSLPNYLSEYRSWLEEMNGDYRVLMTPIWRGEGSIYNWNGIRYQGVDPYIFLTSQEEVGSSSRSPYYFDYAQSILQYMQQVNTRPATQLLRVKYLVNRNDAMLVTQNEKEQYKYLSEVIYPLSEKQTAIRCEKGVNSVEDGTVTCDIPSTMTDWKRFRYLALDVKADLPSTLELNAVDNANNRLVWDGRGMTAYQLDGRDWNKVVLPLYAPISQNDTFDQSQVIRLEIKAHPVSKPGENVKGVQIREVHLNPGEQKNIREYVPETTFGKLDVYKPTSTIVPPEFGLLSVTKPVGNYLDLFENALEEREQLDTTGFIMSSQNGKKDIQSLSQTSSAKISERIKISSTRYWLKVTGDTNAYVILSKTYYPGWKIIEDADKNIVNGSFFNNILLFTKPSLSESEHYVVNGYANLWKVNGREKAYAVIFLPQLIADLGRQISVISVIFLIALLFFLKVKKIPTKK